jgi:hypothetical protein
LLRRGGTVVDTVVELPSDVTCGGSDLKRMYVASIAVPFAGTEITSPNAGTPSTGGAPSRASPYSHPPHTRPARARCFSGLSSTAS